VSAFFLFETKFCGEKSGQSAELRRCAGALLQLVIKLELSLAQRLGIPTA
jgi:hypothetical protein